MVLRWLQKRQHYRSISVSVNGARLTALLADTSVKRMIGLMYRPSIKDGECMLLVFRKEGYQSIWMHNMRFAIDVLWMDSRLRIVDMKEKLQPCSSLLRCRAYSPVRPALYVLEGKYGLISAKRLKKGMRLSM